MIAVVIFYVHIVAAVAVYTRGWMRGGLGEGFLSLAFVATIFTVGWTFSSFILALLVPPEGFATWCDRNTLSLVLLTGLEFLVYRLYFWDYLVHPGRREA